jgi:hypothetical protein
MPRVELKFPVQGINKNWANSEQPPVTSPDMNNVRPYGVAENRLRGGQRPGLNNLLYPSRVADPNDPVVELLGVTFLE